MTKTVAGAVAAVGAVGAAAAVLALGMAAAAVALPFAGPVVLVAAGAFRCRDARAESPPAHAAALRRNMERTNQEVPRGSR